MIYLLIGMSLFFLAIGFIVTENNAKNIISGYNTLDDEEKKKVDIIAYVSYFKKFHLLLGLSFLFIGLIIYLLSKGTVVIFFAVYPIAAYIYFLRSANKYTKGQFAKLNTVGVWTLVITLIIVLAVFAFAYKEDKVTFDFEKIEFHGVYGEEVLISEVHSIELVNTLPEISFKTHGFAMGEINKGYFKTKDGNTVKLVLNSSYKPYLLITKTDGEKIYFSAREESNEEIYGSMKNNFADSLFEK
ncbi:MAG: DUF3784 domain-containing protein [Bacteroidota bacterium]